MSICFPRNALRIYKSFIRTYMGYADITYDKPNKAPLKNKIENVQYRACTLGLQSLTDRS